MSYFLKMGSIFTVSSNDNMDLHTSLPPGNYVLKYDSMRSQFFLDQVEDFQLPSKLYGDTTSRASRILNTFQSRPTTTGVLLTGEKGSGKTLLAKTICVDATKKNIPTIIINSPFTGDGFNKFLQDIEQEAIIMFDEFEKVYNEPKSQEAILTLLDGVFPTKKLFLLTSNDKYKIDVNMRNRPGRIFYMMDFNGLPSEFIHEYAEDNLVNKAHMDSLCKLAMIFTKLNFDMLKAIVEEMNRYDESPQQVIKMLNAKPEFEMDTTYNIIFTPKEDNVDPNSIDKTVITNPILKSVWIDYVSKPDDEDNIKNYETQFHPTDIIEMNAGSSRIVYQNKDGYKLILEKVKPKEMHYYHAF